MQYSKLFLINPCACCIELSPSKVSLKHEIVMTLLIPKAMMYRINLHYRHQSRRSLLQDVYNASNLFIRNFDRREIPLHLRWSYSGKHIFRSKYWM